MRLLISPRTERDLDVLLAAGADIIDVKEPAEGSLGAAPGERIERFARRAHARGVEVSAALGDLPALPGTAALAAEAASARGADWVKVGLLGGPDARSVEAVARAVRRAVDGVGRGTRAVLGIFADLPAPTGGPREFVRAAAAGGAHGVLVDTWRKDDGRSLVDHWTSASRAEFVDAAREEGLEVALAGSLREHHLRDLLALAPDLLGVRGAVCRGADRLAEIDLELARRWIDLARGEEAAR